MFEKQFDFLAIGDMAVDAFIHLETATVRTMAKSSHRELCLPYGDKVPFESAHIIKAVGNSANAAVTASRLGLRTAFISNIGKDANGADCVNELKKNRVDTTYISSQSDKPTNYHYVLWYEDDRTILINHQSYDYKLPVLKKAPKWIYFSSLSGSSRAYHTEVMDYLDAHPTVKLAFQPGTFQMKLGTTELARLYRRTDVFIVNVEEAQRILGRPEVGFISNDDLKEMLRDIHTLGPKLVLITDGPKGAYMYDGDHSYYMPIYPDPKPPYERTGCGDSFAATFVSALELGHTPLEALLWAPINPMSVVQYIGAQQGLLTRSALEALLSTAPQDYHPKEI